MARAGDEVPEFHESAAAKRAFDDYRSMGVSRSIERLVQLYQNLPEEEVPATSRYALQQWHDRFAWDARCAEYEAHLAEKSESLMVKDRAYRKSQRLNDYDQTTDICRQLLQQLREQIKPYTVTDPHTGEITTIYPLPVEKLVALLPRIGTLLIQANAAIRSELGEDVQRHHITIERVIDAFPAEYRQPLREALYEQLELGPGGAFTDG